MSKYVLLNSVLFENPFLKNTLPASRVPWLVWFVDASIFSAILTSPLAPLKEASLLVDVANIMFYQMTSG